MSVNPTEYDLVQDGRLDGVESLVKTTYDPPSGLEYSYPLVDQPMNDEMWQYVTLAIGDGLLDTGGQPYWLRNNGSAANTNSTNTMLLTVSKTSGIASAILRGFYHRMLADITLSFPGVTAETVYYVVLRYDPEGHSQPGGPISVKAVTSLDKSGGKFNLVLWTVKRRPSQLLSEAEIVQFRQKISPSLTVDTRAQLPDVGTVLWGTRVLIHSTREEVMAWGSNEEGVPNAWMDVSDPEWVEYPDTPTYVYVGHGYRRAIHRKGRTRRLRGRIAPADGSRFSSTSSNGYLLFTLAEGDRPNKECRFITAGPRGANTGACSVTVYSDGVVRAWPIGEADYTWMSLDGIEFDIR